MQIDVTRYTAMRPYFNVIRDALTGLVDGDDFFDYFADDASIEFVITVPDYPRTVTGPEQLADLYADYGQAIVQNDSSNMHRYYDPDKSTVIIEYTIHGTLVATSRPYSNRFVAVITIGNGKITHWRDYLDPLAVIAAFTETSAPGTRGQ